MRILFAFLVLVFNFSLLNAQDENKKVVLITGTASGIGKATTEYSLNEGCIVYGGNIHHEKNKYLDGIGGRSLEMDVREADQVKAGVERVIDSTADIEMSEPVVIAKVIGKAIRKKKPKKRYVKGKMAKSAILFRNTFEDKM